MPHTHVGLKTVTVSPQWSGTHNYSWVMSGDDNGSWVTAAAQTDVNGNVTDVWDFTIQDNPAGTQRVATCTVLHNNGVTSDSFTVTQIANPNPAATTTSTTSTTTTTTTTSTTTAAPAESYTNLTVIGSAGGASTDEVTTDSITFTVAGANIPDGTTISIASFTRVSPSNAAATTSDWIPSTSSMISNSASGTILASDLNDFVFSGNQAVLDLHPTRDFTTEGPETFEITLATQSSTGVAHGLGPTFQFTINDTSIYIPITLAYNNSATPNLLGSSVASNTPNGVSLTTYTWDNYTNPTGPAHSIIFNGTVFGSSDIGNMMSVTGGTGNLVNTPGAVYWSNNADGTTDDSQAIAFTAGSSIVNSMSLSPTNVSNGIESGDGSLSFTDGPPAITITTTTAQIN